MKRNAVRGAAVCAAVALLAACGSSKGSSGSSTGTTVAPTAAPTTGGASSAPSGGASIPRAPGYDPATKTITLGVLMALSGPVASIGQNLLLGSTLYWKDVDAAGGIDGYKVNLLTRDNQYDAQVTAQQYQSTKNSVAFYDQILGTAPAQAIATFFSQDQILEQPDSVDSTLIHQAGMVPWGVPYQIAAVNGVEYYIKTSGNPKPVLCTVGENDPLGQSIAQGTAFAAAAHGLKLAAAPVYDVTATSFSAQVAQLKSAHCDAVTYGGTTANIAQILGAAAQEGFDPKWYTSIAGWTGALTQTPEYPYMAKNLTVVFEGSQWGAAGPGMQQLLASLKTYSPKTAPSQFIQIGFALSMQADEILAAAIKRGDLTRSGIEAASNSLPEIDYGGLVNNYKWGPPADRAPARTNTIFSVDASIPNGLKAVATNFTSAPAAAFKL